MINDGTEVALPVESACESNPVCTVPGTTLIATHLNSTLHLDGSIHAEMTAKVSRNALPKEFHDK